MKKITKVFLSFMILTIVLCIGVFAADDSRVLHAYTADGDFTKDDYGIYVHVYNPGGKEVKATLPDENGGDVQLEVKKTDDLPIHTYILIDNSYTIGHSGQVEGIKAMVDGLVRGSSENDVFTVATFDKNLVFLCENQSDSYTINTAVRNITYKAQDSSMSNAIKRILELVDKAREQGTDKIFRIIIVGDGAEETTVNSSETVIRRIKETGIQIYIAGIVSGDNSEALGIVENWAGLSGGQFYDTSEVNFSSIGTYITNDFNKKMQEYKITPVKDSLNNKAEEYSQRKNVKVKLTVGGDELVFSAEMPKIDNLPVIEESVIEPDNEISKVGIKGFKEEFDFMQILPFIIIGIIIVIIIIIIIIIAVSSSKKKKAMAPVAPVDLSRIGHSSDTAMIGGPMGRSFSGTEILGGGGFGDKTDIIGGAVRTTRIRLQDIKDTMRTFEYPIRGRVLVGKNASKCQIVIDYNRFVSSVHCEILAKGTGFVVRDGGDSVIASTNGTFVNDVKVAPEAPLPAGSILRLGEVSFRVTYI